MEDPRIGSLDRAFLFSLGTVGLLISFTKATMQDFSGAVEAIPFMLLGILLPIIVGYKRGAIETGLIEERLRGWVYFIVGMTSYFGLFIFGKINVEWVYRETLFIFLVFLSVYLAYRFFKWSKRLFKIRAISSIYALSGTALCAFLNAFLCRLIVSYYLDFVGKDVLGMMRAGSPEPLFWISLIVASFSIILIFERASRNALQATLALPKINKRFSGFLNFPFIKGLRLASMLFEAAFVSSLKACFFWTQAFALWVLGCILWVANAQILPLVFFFLTIVYSLIAMRFFVRVKISLEGIDSRVHASSRMGYFLLFTLAIILMLLNKPSQPWAVVVIMLLTIHYLLMHYREGKRQKHASQQHVGG